MQDSIDVMTKSWTKGLLMVLYYKQKYSKILRQYRWPHEILFKTFQISHKMVLTSSTFIKTCWFGSVTTIRGVSLRLVPVIYFNRLSFFFSVSVSKRTIFRKLVNELDCALFSCLLYSAKLLYYRMYA